MDDGSLRLSLYEISCNKNDQIGEAIGKLGKEKGGNLLLEDIVAGTTATEATREYYSLFFDHLGTTLEEAGERASRLYLPSLNRYSPLSVRIMEDISRYSGLTFKEVLAINCLEELEEQILDENESKSQPTLSCTSIALHHINSDRNVALHTFDWSESPTANYVLRTGNISAVGTFPLLPRVGIWTDGTVHQINTLYCKGDLKSIDGLPRVPYGMEILLSGSMGAAKRIFDKTPRIASQNHHFINLETGHDTCIEAFVNGYETLHNIAVHTNYPFSRPEEDLLREKYPSGFTNALGRVARAKRQIDKCQNKPLKNAIPMLLKAFKICEYYDPADHPGDQEATVVATAFYKKDSHHFVKVYSGTPCKVVPEVFYLG
jgi:hypothetical protein